MRIQCQRISQQKDWQIITPAQLGIINFVYAPKVASLEEIDNYSKTIAEKIMHNGFAMMTTTKINDLTVLRMCPIHPGLRKQDIKQTIALLNNCAKSSVS